MAFPGRSSSGFSAAIKKAPETLRFQAPLPVLCGAREWHLITHCLFRLAIAIDRMGGPNVAGSLGLMQRLCQFPGSGLRPALQQAAGAVAGSPARRDTDPKRGEQSSLRPIMSRAKPALLSRTHLARPCRAGVQAALANPGACLAIDPPR